MSRPTAAPAIVVEQLVREFKKGPRAVDGIDLEIAGGETYGFLGPNGAGALFGGDDGERRPRARH